jgi:hypothetical protein
LETFLCPRKYIDSEIWTQFMPKVFHCNGAVEVYFFSLITCYKILDTALQPFFENNANRTRQGSLSWLSIISSNLSEYISFLTFEKTEDLMTLYTFHKTIIRWYIQKYLVHSEELQHVRCLTWGFVTAITIVFFNKYNYY